MNLAQLRAKLRGIVAQMRSAHEAGNTEEYSNLQKKANDIKAEISRLEEIEALDSSAGPEPPQANVATQPAPQNRQPEQSDDELRQRMLNASQQEEASTNGPRPSMANNGSGTQDGFSNGERRDLDGFRLVDYCRETVAMMQGQGGGLSGLNREINQEAHAEANTRGIQIRGAGIPFRFLNYAPRVPEGYSMNRLGQRFQAAGMRGFNPRNDMVAGTTTAGGHLIATELRSPIDVLRERLRVVQLGATLLTDLQGDIDFPRWAVGSDPTEKAENAAADEYDPTLSKFTMSPKRLPIFTEVSNQLLIQGSADVEAWLRFELGFRQASVVDKRAINGSGASNQPTGLLNYSGVNSVAIGTNGGAVTRDHLVDMETAIAEDNADNGVMGFLTTPGVRGALKKTKVDAGSGQFVWPRGQGAEELEGYRALTSTNVPSNLTKGSGTDLHAIMFGVWSNLLIGQWGGVDIVVNPFSRDTEGLIRLTFTIFYDINFRYPEAFSKIVDADPTA